LGDEEVKILFETTPGIGSALPKDNPKTNLWSIPKSADKLFPATGSSGINKNVEKAIIKLKDNALKTVNELFSKTAEHRESQKKINEYHDNLAFWQIQYFNANYVIENNFFSPVAASSPNPSAPYNIEEAPV
jgi:hypothetical protein